MAPRWSDAEREHLADLAGSVPWTLVERRFSHWAEQTGHPPRTPGAIRAMAESLVGSRVATGDWIRLSVVQRVAGVTAPAALRWIRQGQLTARLEGRNGRGRWYVSRHGLRDFMRRHPQYFAGLSRADLAALLDPGSPLTDELADRPRPYLFGRPRPVVCVETGARYPSAAAVARKLYVTPSAVRAAISKGTPTAGRHFRYQDAA